MGCSLACPTCSPCVARAQPAGCHRQPSSATSRAICPLRERPFGSGCFYRSCWLIIKEQGQKRRSVSELRTAAPYVRRWPCANWNSTRRTQGATRMEKRRASRSSSGYKPAKLSFGPGKATHFCIVHNRSDRGLCLELTFEADELPNHFELSFDDFRTVHTCKTVWRDDNIAGVAYESSSSEAHPGGQTKLRLVK